MGVPRHRRSGGQSVSPPTPSAITHWLDGITLSRKVLRSCAVDPDVRGGHRSPDSDDQAHTPSRQAASPTRSKPSAPQDGRCWAFGEWVHMLAEYGRAALRDPDGRVAARSPAGACSTFRSAASAVAAQSWDIGRIPSGEQARGITLNDTVLAMSAGRAALPAGPLTPPDQPLIARSGVDARNGVTAGERAMRSHSCSAIWH